MPHRRTETSVGAVQLLEVQASNKSGSGSAYQRGTRTSRRHRGHRGSFQVGFSCIPVISQLMSRSAASGSLPWLKCGEERNIWESAHITHNAKLRTTVRKLPMNNKM